MNRILR